MGNGIRRQLVDERYTRPQGLYESLRAVDLRRLRRLILDGKLAPCYPGLDDPGELAGDLEDCPICFLHYPCLNRSKCCMKGICTECFLQMKSVHMTRISQCPFCKSPNYMVEFRGVKSNVEKGLEQIEEQRVIEARIRIQQQALIDEAENIQRRKSVSTSVPIPGPRVRYHEAAGTSQSAPYSTEGSKFLIPQPSLASFSGAMASQLRETSDDNDLEELMVAEAIWLSLQDQEVLANEGNNPVIRNFPETSQSGGYASAFQLAHGTSSSVPTMRHVLRRPERSYAPNPRFLDVSSPRSSYIEESSIRHGAAPMDWWSEVAEAGTSRASSGVTGNSGVNLYAAPGAVDEEPFDIPDSFEEQLTMAMAASLAEAPAAASPGLIR